MFPGLNALWCILLAWLIGSTPFSLLIARWMGGFDLRTRGSGNVGATNVARTMGTRWGLLALLLDALKGAMPAWGLPLLFQIPTESLTLVSVLTGVAAILGHMFPLWLRFRGGKGVATALGVVVVLAPSAMGCALAVFVVTFLISRVVSLASMAGAVAFAIAQISMQGAELWSPQQRALGIFSLAVPLLIIIRHRANIGRLWRGEEKPLQIRKPSAAAEHPAGSMESDHPDAA